MWPGGSDHLPLGRAGKPLGCGVKGAWEEIRPYLEGALRWKRVTSAKSSARDAIRSSSCVGGDRL